MAGRSRVSGAVVALLVVGLLLTGWHVVWSVWRAQAFGFVDFPIFLRNAVEVGRTGELYRSKDDLSYYAPAAPVYKFPPLYAVFLLPLVADGADRGDLAAHYWLQLGLYVLAVFLLLRLARAGPRTATLGAVLALLTLNFEPFYETLWRLQLETVLLLLVVLAAVALRRGHEAWAGAALGLAVMFKLYPAVLLGWLVVRRRAWGLVGAAVAMVAAVGVTVAVFGVEENRFYLTTLLPHLLAEPPLIDIENVSVARFLHHVTGMSPAAAKGAARLVLLPALALTIWIAARAAPRRDGPGLLLELTPWAALMLLAMPNSWVNYQLLLLPGFVALAAAAWGAEAGGLRRRALTATIVAAYVPLLFYAPCAAAETGWPCAQTQPVLGLVFVPRGLHEAFVGLRGLSPLLVWGAALAELRSGYLARPTNVSIDE